MSLNPPQAYRKIEFTHRIGVAADRPAASDVLIGTLYFSNDTFTLERSNGTSWDSYGGGSGGGSGSIGPMGPPGFDGYDGLDGINGLNGINGINGINGTNGIPGLDGIDGEDNLFFGSFPQIPQFYTVISNTGTGAINNWAPGIIGNTLIEWSGASDVTITGLAGGIRGQFITIKNTGTKVAYFAHNSGSSSAENKFKNYATSGFTPISVNGNITYQYDGTDWQIINHNQGTWIFSTYNSSDYTASIGTWTVDFGDVATCIYLLSGNTLSCRFSLFTTSVSSTPTTLNRIIPGGFTSINRVDSATIIRSDNAGTYGSAGIFISASGTIINFYVNTSFLGSWSISTNGTAIVGDVSNIEVL